MSRLTGEFDEKILVLKRRYVKVIMDLIGELQDREGGQGIDLRVATFSLFGMMNWIYTWYQPKRDLPLAAVDRANAAASIFLACSRPAKSTTAGLHAQPVAHRARTRFHSGRIFLERRLQYKGEAHERITQSATKRRTFASKVFCTAMSRTMLSRPTQANGWCCFFIPPTLLSFVRPKSPASARWRRTFAPRMRRSSAPASIPSTAIAPGPRNSAVWNIHC